MDRGVKQKRKPFFRDNANLFSKLSFFYTLKLFRKGFRKSLEVEDMYDVNKSCESKRLGDQIEKALLQEMKSKKRPSIIRILWKCYGNKFIVLGLIQFVMKTVVTILAPELLSKFVACFDPEQAEYKKSDAVFYGISVVVFNFLDKLYGHNFVLYVIEIGVQLRVAVSALLYRKTLKLEQHSMSRATMGKIITIITKDIDSLEMAIEYAHYIWIGIIQTVIICYLIYNKIGYAAFAGVSIFLLILPLQLFIGKITYNLRLLSSQKTDERLELTQETLSSIKVIKMYTWERFFVNRINVARKIELSTLRKIFYTTVAAIITGELCSKVAFFFFVMTYVWLGNSITAELVYFIKTCFNNLEYTLAILIPYGIYYSAAASAASKRINSVLAATELEPSKRYQRIYRTPEINFRGVTISAGDTKILNNISLKIEKGLNILVGHIGSGKTTFFKAILNEYNYIGDLKVNGTISYSSQEPWLFPSTIKNNILFGEEFNEKRYQRVLEICALTYDLEFFKDHDQTVVSDRGVNLSKGQQARINLARAIYRNSDIYLLDDSLAALDAQVSDTIFEQCMKTFLKHKIVIFTTNNLKYIKRADKIIMIDHGNVRYGEKSEIDKEMFGNDQNNLQEKENLVQTNHIDNAEKRIYAEEKQSGKVPMNVYFKYIKFGGGYLVFSFIMLIFTASQAVSGYSEKLMSNWVTLEQNLSSFKEYNTSTYKEIYNNRTNTLSIYIGAVIIGIVFIIVKSMVYFGFIRRVSINLHKTLIKKIVNGTMTFFDTTFIGNILNRFSKDLTTIDEFLPFVIVECLRMIFVVPSSVILLITVDPQFLFGVFILLFFGCLIRIGYQSSGRNLHRLSAITRSPMIGHLNSTLEGLTTIRASQAEDIVRSEYDQHQNLYISTCFASNCCATGLCFALDMLCTLFLATVIFLLVATNLDTAIGDVGMAITQCFVITEVIVTGIRQFSECENQMTSVERILEYTNIKGEQKNGTTLNCWPKTGLIEFTHVSLAYSKQNQNMLNDITLKIDSGSKIGIVGRTGAGKSSLVSCLLRLHEFSGKILIDNADIQTLSLDYLRSQIAVIPQDPVLFYGTIRENFDPFKNHRDEEIWRVIDDLKLNSLIQNLNKTVSKTSNFSSGQKQLMCLARAILRKNKIVILDEASANVDPETDFLIHEAVKSHFKCCTVIIIAHRLLSVMDCDKVIVIDQGRVTEMDHPTILMNNRNSFLHLIMK